MTDCAFIITFHQSTAELIERTRKAVSAKGGNFEGDVTSGKFSIPAASGTVAGTYRVEDHVFHFSITEMPEDTTCHKVENTFRSLIGSPPDTSLDFS
ncbi:hypothetical protein [Lewinella sp. JB7]|uniref:hypothetical protein n=1 Tax=Lewinella sp. JB7 TaxID=2962887 RepID=UPI0020C9D4B8|nr:hypothetical protein [Lewinella sp. JB7]MCP9237840.1 hypothetical protein [Lewinella sp. JB7]